MAESKPIMARSASVAEAIRAAQEALQGMAPNTNDYNQQRAIIQRLRSILESQRGER